MDNRDAQYWDKSNKNNSNKTGMRNLDHYSHNVLSVVGAILTVEFIVPVVVNGIKAIASLWGNSNSNILEDNCSRRDCNNHNIRNNGHQRRH